METGFIIALLLLGAFIPCFIFCLGFVQALSILNNEARQIISELWLHHRMVDQ